MEPIRRKLRSLLADQGGATAIEYGLIASLIVIAIIASLGQLGGGTGGMWTNLSDVVANS